MVGLSKFAKDNKLPTSFELLGQVIKVKIDNDFNDGKNAIGYCRTGSNIITISDRRKGDPVAIEKQVQVLLHEVVHMILFAIGEDDLSHKEAFIELFSGVLHQVLKTMKFK